MKSKNKEGYDLVDPSEEPTRGKERKEPFVEDLYTNKDEDGEKERKKKDKKFRFRKSLWVCCSNVEIGSKVQSHDEKKKKAHDEFKVKEGIFFSSVDIEPEKDIEKVIRNKHCFLICCSNIEAGN